MSAEATIDYMTTEDLSEVLQVESRSFDDPWPEDVFRAELRHCWSHCRVLRAPEGRDPEGAVLPGRVIGYLVFWSVADEVHLLNIAVHPDERHHHYGRQLLDYMMAYAREHGVRFVTLEVRSSNEAAIQLYESGGFRQVGVRPTYYANNGEDAIVMLCDLGSQSGLSAIG